MGTPTGGQVAVVIEFEAGYGTVGIERGRKWLGGYGELDWISWLRKRIVTR
jgi:hypothetical protein